MVSCSECGVTVISLDFKGQMERHNDISVPQMREVAIGCGGGGGQYPMLCPPLRC